MTGLLITFAIIVIAVLTIVVVTLRSNHPRDARRREVKAANQLRDQALESRDNWANQFRQAHQVIYDVEVLIRDTPIYDVVGDELRRQVLENINRYRIENKDKH